MTPPIGDTAQPVYNIRLLWYTEEADDVLVRTGRLQVARLRVVRVSNPCQPHSSRPARPRIIMPLARAAALREPMHTPGRRRQDAPHGLIHA